MNIYILSLNRKDTYILFLNRKDNYIYIYNYVYYL